MPAWAGQAVLEFRCVTGDWAGALERLERNMKSGLIDKPSYQRQRAVLLTARALANEEMDRDRAKADVLEAVKLAPDAGAGGRARRAAARRGRRSCARPAASSKPPGGPIRIPIWPKATPICGPAIRRASGSCGSSRWPRNRPATSRPRWRSAAPRSTRRNSPSPGETLAPLAVVPTQRVAALMAELEEKEHNDEGRARAWMARALHGRRDPAWTADGFVSQRWLPISPVTGRLDAFEWKDPLSGLDGDRPVIEAGRDRRRHRQSPGHGRAPPGAETPLDLTRSRSRRRRCRAARSCALSR